MPESSSGWADDTRRIKHRYEQILIEIIQQGIDEGSIRSFAPARELTSTLSAAKLGRIFADTQESDRS